MAVNLKTDSEIEKMKAGGKILAGVLEEVKAAAKPGVKTIELDKLAEQLILEAGCQISFQTVRGYKWSTCLCVNDVVVHGLPSEYELKEGDLLGIDVGLIYQDLHLDMAETILISSVVIPTDPAKGGGVEESSEAAFGLDPSTTLGMTKNITLNDRLKFLSAGKKALVKAIGQAKAGNRIGHISQAIEEMIKSAGYSVVYNLVGHGVGKTLHEDPHIPGVLQSRIEETLEIVVGMTLAIEVIYNLGGPEVAYTQNDGWTIATVDKSLSATFEKSIAVLENGPIVLTKTA